MCSDITRQKGIYIHIPFCISKCIYCDFCSAPADEGIKEKYVSALCREIRQAGIEMEQKGESRTASTVFFGGGTPSILRSSQIVEIMNAVREAFRLTGDVEITMECNPGTLTKEKLRTYRYVGVNRLSIGLQSTNNRDLKKLGRIHTYEQFEESYIDARLAGFNNINVDIMSAIPGQTPEKYAENLRRVVALKTEHISAYSLIVEENTPLYDMVGRTHGSILPTEEDDRRMYAMTKEILGEAGYNRYEISNYAKPGYECRHNCFYWNRTEYLGFGLAAASLSGNRRYTNTSDMDSYLADPIHNHADEQILTAEDEMEEYMFLGLRMMKGVDKAEFTYLFGKDYDEVYGDITRRHIEQGLMAADGSRLYLTDMGIDISNTVMADYIL